MIDGREVFVDKGVEGWVYHDEGAIFVRLLAQGVQFCDGIVEGLFGEVTCSIGGVQDLIVKDREIECKTEADLVFVRTEHKEEKRKWMENTRKHPLR